MPKRVLLTGISGSIGVHVLIHIFHNTDWEVVGLASYKHKGLAERITEMLREHPEYWDRLKLITHDLKNPITPKIAKKIGKINYVINLASMSDVDASIKNPVPFIKNNIDLTVNLLEYVRNIWGLDEKNHTPPKDTAFIQFSTDEVYGPSGVDQRHPEWSAIVPSNPYAASKACQEAIAISYWRTYGAPVIITNTMNNFGEYQQPNKFPVMVQRAVMRGETVTIHGTPDDIGTRYYIHSRNAADAIIFILENLPPHIHEQGAIDRPDRYNVVGDKQINNLEFAQIIAKKMDKKLEFKFLDFHSSRPGHDKHYGLSGEKLQKAGWTSPLGFEESLDNTIKWQMDHADWIENEL